MPRRDQTINGVRVRAGFLPVPHAYVGSGDGPAIVLARAPGWQDEYDLAQRAAGYDAPVFGVNAHMPYWGCLRFDHGVSVHGNMFRPMPGTVLHTVKRPEQALHADVHWPLCGTGNGSSALTATLIALLMGYSPVVVAGVHLMLVSERWENGRRIRHSYANMQDGWHARRDEVFGRVFSVSPPGTFLRDFLNPEGGM